MDAVTAASQWQGKNGDRKPREAYYDTHLQDRHGAALGGAERHHPGPAEDGLRAGDLALQGRARRSIAEAGGADHRRGGVAPRAGAGEPDAARQVAHHAIALRRLPAHHAGRDRAAAPPRRRRRSASSSTARAPTPRSTARRPSWRRATSSLTPYWTIARPRQHLEEADDVARRARRADGQLLRDELLRALRRGEAEHQARRRRLAGALRLGRAAGRHRHVRSSAARSSTIPTRKMQADPRAPGEDRRHRSAPWRARALRQPGHRRLGDADHGRASRACCRRASRARTTSRPTAPSSSASRARAAPRSAARCWSGVRRTCSWFRRG